ncbi:MAG TPA: hypothetical protein VE913_15445 [Longimicrobium sp.]|nr:hypothetical protein [Longimicrobium sp.]
MHPIRTTLFGLAIACASLAQPAAAQQNVKLDDNADVRIVGRQPARRAASMLQTSSGNVALLLIDRTLVFQFTDAGLRGMEAESAPDEDDGIAARIIGGMVRGGLRRLFDHGLEYPLSELREARYTDGQLILIDRKGKQLFEDMDVNGSDVMRSFPAAEGRAFAARINQELRRRSI